MAAQLRDHLRDRELLVLQFDAGNFLAAFENLLEDFYEIDKGDNEFTFGAFVVIKRFVGLGPDVFFDLLALIKELRGVFEFFVFEQALD